MNGNIVSIDGQHYLLLDKITRSTHTEPLCPVCSGGPHGTAEVTTAVAYGRLIDNATIVYSGETNSDEIWMNQTTLTLDGLPVLECVDCFTRFTHPNVTETQ